MDLEKWEVEPMRKFKHDLDQLVDEFLVAGHRAGLVQSALTDVLCTDLIERQEGLMAMMDARYEQEDQDELTWENYRG